MTSTNSTRLCVVGDYAWDVLVHTETELRRGGDTFGHLELHPGGSAANVAVWARRCGANVAFIGKVGADRFGALAREELESETVEHHLVISADRATGSVGVIVDPGGERSMVSGHGADFYLEPAELPASVIAASTHLHLTGWSVFTDPPRPAITHAARLAHDAGATVSFDPASFQVIDEVGVDVFIDWVYQLGPDILFPNRDEGQILTGADDPDAMARRLRELFPHALVVLKLGSEGCLIAEGDELHEVPTTPGQLVDATGAGDSFAGAFLAHWLDHRDPVAAATYASPIAAWVITQTGARPRLDDTASAAVQAQLPPTRARGS